LFTGKKDRKEMLSVSRDWCGCGGFLRDARGGLVHLFCKKARERKRIKQAIASSDAQAFYRCGRAIIWKREGCKKG
jgi:hypothetical protein